MTHLAPARIAARNGATSCGRTRASTCGRSSVEYAAEPSPGKCFGQAAFPSPRANATPIGQARYCRDPRGPSGASSTGAKSTSTPARRSARRVSRPAASASPSVGTSRAARHGGAAGNAFTRPPSWSAKRMPAGLVKIPGRSVVTTTARAFCSGVMVSTARKTLRNDRNRTPSRLGAMDFALTEEQRLIQETVRSFVDERVLPIAVQNDIEHRLDLDLISGLAELGILGIVIPEEYGGAGLDFVAEALACEEIERGEAAFRTLISVH